MRLLVCLLATAACTRVTSDFVCEVDADCTTDTGADGRCEFNHRCSYADPSCASGSRFGDFAGGASDQCTAAGCTGVVRAGPTNTCMLTGAGSVWCWGNGMATASKVDLPSGIAQLDNNGGGLCVRYPDRVRCTSGDTTLVAADIAVGSNHVCAINANKTVQCWGQNTWGQLGNNSMTTSAAPVATQVISNVTRLASGVETSCAIDASTQVWCWGDDHKGEIGRGPAPNDYFTTVPLQAQQMTNAVQVAVGNQFACSVTSNGAVWCWGNDDSYQLAKPIPFFGINEWDSPQQVSGVPATIIQVTTGAAHACALADDGRVWCWGSNASHEAAAATDNPVMAPTLVVDKAKQAVRFHDIDAGDHHTCGRSATDGSVLCWGANAMAQIGDGTTETATYPTPLAVTCD